MGKGPIISASARRICGGTTRRREQTGREASCDRSIRREPFRAHGRVHRVQIRRQLRNRGPVTVGKVTNDCAFVLLITKFMTIRRMYFLCVELLVL